MIILLKRRRVNYLSTMTIWT